MRRRPFAWNSNVILNTPYGQLCDAGQSAQPLCFNTHLCHCSVLLIQCCWISWKTVFKLLILMLFQAKPRITLWLILSSSHDSDFFQVNDNYFLNPLHLLFFNVVITDSPQALPVAYTGFQYADSHQLFHPFHLLEDISSRAFWATSIFYICLWPITHTA